MNAEQKQAVENLKAFGDALYGTGSEPAKQMAANVETLLKAVREMGEDTKRLLWAIQYPEKLCRICDTEFFIAGTEEQVRARVRDSIDRHIKHMPKAISQSGVKEEGEENL